MVLTGITISGITHHLSYKQKAHTNSNRPAEPENESVWIFIMPTALQ